MDFSKDQDHLDSSPSETVRRHAATFQSVRERLLADRVAAREREAADELTRAWNEGDGLAGDGRDPERVRPHRVGSYALPVAAARFEAKARGAGWRTEAAAARGRKGGDGPWVDSVVVRAHRRSRRTVLPVASLAGYWRCEPVVVPWRPVWKFVAAVAWDRESGTRSVGARELAALVDDLPDAAADASTPSLTSQAPSAPDTLECKHETVRGGGGPDGEDRS